MHQTPPNREAPARVDFGSNLFVSSWSLQNYSLLFVCTNVVKFARYTFPPTVVTDMEAIGCPVLAHNMSYVAAQVMFYLVFGSRRIQLLNEMEVAHASYRAREVELKHQIDELEKNVHDSDQRYALLASEKTIVEEIRSLLEAKVDSLTEALCRDKDWLLQVGVMCIMDKLNEHMEFTSMVSQIRHAAFFTGEEFGHCGLKADVDSSAYDPNSSDSRSSHTTRLNDALFDFATIDHASLLGFGHLEMEEMRQICALEDVGEIYDDMLIEGAGGGGNQNVGGSGGAVVGGDCDGDGGVEANNGDNSIDS